MPSNPKPFGSEEIDHIVSNIRVGLHTNLPVLYARKGRRGWYRMSHDLTIDGLLTASVNYWDYGHKVSPEQLSTLTRCLLRASYEGTYLAAIAAGTRTLLLTLVGGGSFANPLEIVVEEMARAHLKYITHPKCQIERVILCLYGAHGEQECELLSKNGVKLH